MQEINIQGLSCKSRWNAGVQLKFIQGLDYKTFKTSRTKTQNNLNTVHLLHPKKKKTAAFTPALKTESTGPHGILREDKTRKKRLERGGDKRKRKEKKNRAKKGRWEKDPKEKKPKRRSLPEILQKKRKRHFHKKGGGAAKSKTSRRCPLPPSFFLTSIPPSLSIKSWSTPQTHT